MQIEIADKSGFCFGRRPGGQYRVQMPRRIPGNSTVTYGMLIHNRDLTDDLAEKGVGCIDAIEDIPDGSSVIIRAHGIPKSDYKKLEEIHADIVDATCRT